MSERFVVAIWIGVSSTFAIGAGLENVHSFSFLLFSGGTIASIFLWGSFRDG